MFALILDVRNHFRNLGLADREPTITVLPFKATELWKLFVNPFRRFALQILSDLARAKRGRGHHESMNVIFDSANLKCSHLVMSGDATDVFPNAIFDFTDNPGFPILDAEGEMVMQ